MGCDITCIIPYLDYDTVCVLCKHLAVSRLPISSAVKAVCISLQTGTFITCSNGKGYILIGPGSVICCNTGDCGCGLINLDFKLCTCRAIAGIVICADYNVIHTISSEGLVYAIAFLDRSIGVPCVFVNTVTILHSYIVQTGIAIGSTYCNGNIFFVPMCVIRLLIGTDRYSGSIVVNNHGFVNRHIAALVVGTVYNTILCAHGYSASEIGSNIELSYPDSVFTG